MHNLPFDKPGRFWRGNLHTHSTNSDGQLSVEATCQQYRQASYDFFALTDHFSEHYNFPITDTIPYRTDDFTTIIGAELHSGLTEVGQIWHILAVGLPPDFAPPQPNETGPQIAARALEAGAYVAAAHPNWYALTEADIRSLGPIHAIEVYNGICDAHNDRADSWHVTDILLSKGQHYFACATDDCHFKPNHRDFARGWVQVKSETLEPDALLNALKAGHYYSSTGPQIHDIQLIPGESITVHCSPASIIYVTGKASKSDHASGQGIREATLSLASWDSPFCRITVRDARGGRAWSNPIWL